MCEQTEINYLDGDIVWVKLGACWWPGQVTGFHNLPEDIQNEFERKPLIAAVKFFQEDTYEFVKNYQQIYKYNCTLKDEFIKKGLDKYRSKSKDGASYMDKFPGDVEMAEKLTGGDPDILSKDKFSPDEKPDISALFGDKKIGKKKREREDSYRRSDGAEIVRKITHPRFVRESDHEVRIRQQPSSLSSATSIGSPQYPCPLCNFTSSRVNVIICHVKSHRSGNSPVARARIKSFTPQKSRISDSETPKRKYVKKEKSPQKKHKSESGLESGKRKQVKQNEKANKKKKTDSELRQKLLADWEDESEEEMGIDHIKSLNMSSMSTSPAKDQSTFDTTEEGDQTKDTITDGSEIIEETEKLLRETEKLTSINVMEDSLNSIHSSKSSSLDALEKKFESEKVKSSESANESESNSPKDKDTSSSENKSSMSDRTIKKSELSCFDFDEDDLPEPSIPPVRKIPRVFGEKNLFLKKEIIKEFEMSQALKTEQEKESENDDTTELPKEHDTGVKNGKVIETVTEDEESKECKKEVNKGNETSNEKKQVDTDNKELEVAQKSEVKTKAKTETETETKIKTKTKTKSKTASSQKDKQKTSTKACEAELEIVEIFEVEKDEGNNDNVTTTTTTTAATASVTTITTTAATTTPTTSPTSITAIATDTAKTVAEEPLSNTDLNSEADDTTKDNTTSSENKSVDKREPPQSQDIITNDVTMESSEPIAIKETDETLSEQLTTETEDETVSESADTIPEQSENSDIDAIDQERKIKAKSSNAALRGKQDNNNERSVKKRRGRPRKTLDSPTHPRPTSESESIKLADKTNKRFKVLEKFEAERKTSESDTERSSSGRKRKPNKKYLESNIYVQDAEKSFKTDESQSESDDKVIEKTKRKARKGKKALAIEMKNIELTEQIKEQELNLSEQMLQDVAEGNIKSDSKDDINLTPKSDKGNKADKGKEFVGLEKLMLLEDQANLDFSADLQDSEMMSTEHSDSDMLSETMKLPTTEEAILETIGAIRPEPIKTKKQEESSGVLDKKEVAETEPKSSKEESVSMVVESEIVPEKVESPQQLETSKTNVEMLPPKKSQIKKFELSQIDFLETSTPTIKTITEAEFDRKMDEAMEMSAEAARIDSTEEIDDILAKDKESTEEKVVKSPKVEIAVEEEAKTKVVEDKPAQQTEDTPTKDVEVSQAEAKPAEKPTEPKSESTEVAAKDTSKVSEDPQKRTAIQTRYKGKFTPETGAKSKKDKDLFSEEKPVNTFQEAFLKTLQMDKKKGSEDSETPSVKGKKGKKINKKKSDEQDNLNTTPETQEKKVEVATEKVEVPETVPGVQTQGNLPEVSVMSNFEGVEVVVEEIDAKVDDAIFQSNQLASSSSPSSDFTIISKPTTQSPITEDTTKTLSIDVPKVEEVSKMSPSTPSPSSDVNVPVKKREMPRIIENITLTEPMQILKSKLLDKLPQKGVKHKLESEVTKKGDQRGSPKAKIMKIESLPSNTKMKTGMKVTSPHISLTKKLQVLKAEEAETSMAESQNEKLNIQTSQTLTTTPVTEKYIQQSSQSLADMELDINSMPFVLSEDVLTPESIEQMPVVISSIIPASSSIPATLSFTPTTQMVSPTQTQFKLTNENTTELSPTKKKSGTPTILKNKNKAKPTITSIKTLVPPLTGGVKGVKFQSTQPSKTTPLLTQKGTSGKYVVVQTSGGQQLRYSVQGKTSTQQKIAIPTGKTTGNAQVIQQGGKVIILTSDQSGQTKMLPLNISKTLGGKVQRIMTNKGQVFCPISPQSIVSKTIIAPKGDAGTSTTSKLASGHKIISTQGIIASKAVLTPIPGTITKTALLGTLSQGIITKGGVYTPISTSTLGPKTIIGPKTLITGKGATILSSQNLGTSKAILTPITEALTGKTIPSTQRIVSTKATVLTPITGQQVKAIAAKSPSKGSKVQYQSVQQKVQLPMLQKSPKIAVSPASQARSSGTPLKSASGSLVLQSTQSTPKGLQQGKKIIKQTIVQGTSMQGLSSSASSQQTVSMVPQVQQKGKSVPTSIVQKVIIPRGSGRQSKSQQKIVVQKLQEPAISTVQNTQLKQTLTAVSPNVPTVSKSIIQQKQIVGGLAATKSTKTVTNKSAQQQKNLLNLAMNSAATTTTVNTSFSAPLSLPPLEPIEPEKKSKIDNTIIETAVQKEQPKSEKFNIEKSSEVEKVEEPKITAQPQIMALPTESSDGTQTYVLVTIDEQGQIQPLDNNTLMSLEGTTQNPDGTRTLYIDPSSLGEAGTLDNIVLQFDNGVLPNLQTTVSESNQTVISESFPASEVIQTSNQDILAAALANTDFQQEINLPENPAGSVMTTGLTQTSLINQTILQSTIIPPTEPISSPSVLETSLTLNQPIMTPLEVPSSLPIQSDTTPTSVVSTIPSSLELPITITNPNISYISAGEAQIQIPGNSMPDIGEIIESPSTVEISRSKIPASTQYLVIPNLDENITVDTQSVQTGAISMPTVSYSVSIPNNIVLENPQVQTTPSMPIIDDSYSENVQFTTPMQASIVTEQSFADVPVSEMLVSKASVASTENITSQDVTATSEMNITSHDVSVSSQESIVSSNEPHILNEAVSDVTMPVQEVYSSQDAPITSKELTMRQSIPKEDTISNATITTQEEISNTDSVVNTQTVEQPTERLTSSMPIIDEGSLVTESDSNIKSQTVKPMNFEVTDSSGIGTSTSEEAEAVDKFKDLAFDEGSDSKDKTSSITEKQVVTSNEVDVVQDSSQVLPTEPLAHMNEETMEVEEAVESEMYAASTIKHSEDYQRDEPSSQGESDNHVRDNLELRFEETTAEMNQETPSQSYEQFGIAMTSDSTDLPSQSATKSGNSREPSQSITYEPMETDEETTTVEPPTQSFEHSKINEASPSYEASAEASTSAPTQSFNEIMQSQEDRTTVDEAIDDQSFPTQSYDIGKAENIPENLETDAEISQEGNIPSQSNDIGTDGIGTSSVSTNNSGLNEDETASSSYVPETPENQERDQDQESAISTSSYEIPPCEELNIASSSVIPDTSVRAEHTSIHDNGVPEIPTSSYNLNPDITSTHVDSVPTSSYEDQVIVEQNVSTSYEVPISMPGLEETCSQNFVTESTDHRNEPSSYYTHQEVTASYYESVDQESNSKLEEDPQEEVTPSYYERNPQEASQSYFPPEEATPSYSSHNVSPSYYPRPESEASQSYYPADDLEKTEQSSSQNIEASQSFYPEQSDELRLRQQGEATPTYSERYPVDYTLDNSPIERHDLVESSVPATRPTER